MNNNQLLVTPARNPQQNGLRSPPLINRRVERVNNVVNQEQSVVRRIVFPDIPDFPIVGNNQQPGPSST